MTCPVCNHIIADDAKFCNVCGAAIGSQGAANAGQAQPNANTSSAGGNYANPGYYNKPQGSAMAQFEGVLSIIMKIFALVFVVVAFIMFIVFLAQRGNFASVLLNFFQNVATAFIVYALAVIIGKYSKK